MFHAFLGEKLPDWKAAATLVRTIAESYKLPYYTISPTYSICKKHGYLNGEQRTCPECGGPTEVYSRITGYYRPVQNWNDGKAQEYLDRKVYDPCSAVAGPEKRDRGSLPETPKNKTLLFTTKTCPNCSTAKALLQRAGLPFEVILAEENRELAKAYGIFKAPTAVVIEGQNRHKYIGVSEIQNYTQNVYA